MDMKLTHVHVLFFGKQNVKPLRREKANSQNTNSLDTLWSSNIKHANGGYSFCHTWFLSIVSTCHKNSKTTHVMCRHTPIGLPQFEVESLKEGECHIIM